MHLWLSCTAWVCRLAIDVAAQQRKLDAEATETRAIQAQLEATADEFRQQHKERRALTEQWDAATAGIRRHVHDTSALHVQMSGM